MSTISFAHLANLDRRSLTSPTALALLTIIPPLFAFYFVSNLLPITINMSQQSAAPSPATQPPVQQYPQPPRGAGGPGGPGGFPFGAAMRHLQQAIDSLHAHQASSDSGGALALPGGAATPLEEASAHLDTVSRFLRSLNPYLNAVSTDPPKLLEGVLDETYSHDWRAAYESGQMEFPMMAGGCAGTYEGGFIGQVAGTLRARRVLEVSARCLVDKCWCRCLHLHWH